MKITPKNMSPDANTRHRRSYSCGPCQRLKVKCDLQIPCGSCFNMNKSADCLKSPPKPPTVQERILTQKRRARLNVRPRRRSSAVDSSDSFSSDISPTQNNSDSLFGVHDPLKLRLSVNDPNLPLSSNQVVWKRLTEIDTSSSNDRLKVTLGLPKHTYEFFQRPKSVFNILKYAFLAQYHLSRSQMFTLWPDYLSKLARELALNITKDECITHFSEFGLRDVSGVTDLFDLKVTLSMMINFLEVFSKKRNAVSICIDADLVEQISISSLIVSQAYVLRGNVKEGNRWLSFSYLLRSCLDKAYDVPSVVFLGIWVVICKTSNFMFNNADAMTTIFDHFFDCMSHPDIAQYVQKDSLNVQHTSHFKAIARIWIIIKLSETEINSLNGHGCSQHKYEALQLTILPSKSLISQLFEQSLKGFKSLSSRFHVILYVGTRYFGRFEPTSSREIIRSYLKLHQELNDLDIEISQSLERNIRPGKGISYLPAEYYDLLTNMLFLKYCCTRLLLFVKLERLYFPSLRFAHYVSNLICLFNWVFNLADAKNVSLDRIFSSIFDRAYFVDIQMIYSSCGSQAIFVAVLKHFTAGDTAKLTIDTNYLLSVITSSMNRALDAIKSNRYSGIPILSQMLIIIERLKSYAIEESVGIETFDEFIAEILKFLGDQDWNSLILIWFGNHQVGRSHIYLLWRIASFLSQNGSNPICIYNNFCIDTDFFRKFEDLVDLFRFDAEEVEQYMEYVVDAAG